MKQYLKKAGILMLLPLAAACASGEPATGGPDWTKSTTYKVKTGHGDRVVMRVIGNATDGYDYHARIRHTVRSDLDPLDRQQILGDAARTIVGKLCGASAKEAQPSYVSNYYERRGRFVCTNK